MFEESPQNLLYLTGGAFAAGWVVAKISAFFANRIQNVTRDPRDSRILSLEAELRVANSDKTKIAEKLEARDKEYRELEGKVGEQAKSLQDQLTQINKLRKDLKDSVRKTDELRNELTDRAEENLRSTMKLQQVETELSVVRASSDLMSTGVLDYNVEDEEGESAQIFKAGS